MIPIEGGADNMVLALDQDKVNITRTGTSNLIHAVINRGSEGVAIAAVFPKQAEPDIKGAGNVIEIKARRPAPKRFVDLRYLQAAGMQ